MIDDSILHPCYRCRHYYNYVGFSPYKKPEAGHACGKIHGEPFDLCKCFEIDKYFISMLKGM